MIENYRNMFRKLHFELSGLVTKYHASFDIFRINLMDNLLNRNNVILSRATNSSYLKTLFVNL